jgi:ligand-binding sensor domain-containing protein/serine phosphatase RsbU (regulator of sigma subunit)
MTIQKIIKRAVLHLLCFILPSAALAQFDTQFHNFRLYDITSGLPQSEVISLHQDKRGYLWVGTHGGGLGRFDGTRFFTFTKKEGLGSNIINAISEDSTGAIWAATSNGLSRISGTEVRTFNEKDGLGSHKIASVCATQDGIWIGTEDSGAYRFDGKVFRSVSRKDGLASDYVISICQGRDGEMWFGTVKGLARYKDGKLTNYGPAEGLKHPGIFAIKQDRNGTLWLGSWGGGLYKFDGNTFSNYSRDAGLSYELVTSVDIDRQGNVWVGSHGGGFCKFDGERFITFNSRKGLSNNIVYALKFDREENLWVGTYHGLNCYLGDVFTYFTMRNGLNHVIVNCIAPGDDGDLIFGSEGGINIIHNNSASSLVDKDRLPTARINAILKDGNAYWIGTYGKGLCYFDGKSIKTYSVEQGISSTVIFYLMRDSKGNMWACTERGITLIKDGKFKVFNETNGFINTGVKHCAEDDKGNIWFATFNGLYMYNGSRFVKPSADHPLHDMAMTSVVFDKKGYLWLGTDENGLIRFAPVAGPGDIKGDITTIDTRKGLSDDAVRSIIFDRKNNLWAGTIKGVDRIDYDLLMSKGQLSIKSYGRLEGFIGVECKANAVCLDTAGGIWFGSINGAVRYTNKEETKSSVEPLTSITGIRLFYQPFEWEKYSSGITDGLPGQLTLPHNKNHLTFDFIGISLKIPEKVSYMYMLEGLDESWAPATRETQATYSNIPPGKYTFHVKAMGADGVWNKKPKSFSFVIEPAFYQTAWFFASMCFMGSLTVLIVFRWRLKRLREARKLLEKEVRLRTRELYHEKEKVEMKNREIAEKNKDITDSITYSRRIQEALLPPGNLLQRMLPEHFVFYRPKDIVSGDFYWAEQWGNRVLVAAVDCTGHGVPGALMSVVGNNLLNQAVNVHGLYKPNLILNALNKGLSRTLRRPSEDKAVKDGMDISLVAIDREKMMLEFSGAYNPLWLVREGSMIEIDGDKFPVGLFVDNEARTFTNHELPLRPGDVIYIFTDGYADQFGGPAGKKFKYKQLRELLISIHRKDMHEQAEILKDTFDKWKGDLEQVDDVCLVGIRI